MTRARALLTLAIVAAALSWACITPPPTPTTTTSTSVDTTQPTTTQPTTTVPPTTTTQPTTTTTPPSSDHPTEFNTGPTVANPPSLGTVHIPAGQTRTISQAVTDGIVVWPGANVTLTNVEAHGEVYVMSRHGDPTTRFRMTDSAAYNGMRVNTVDASENLDWGHQVYGDIRVDDSWIWYPQGSGTQHTEALSSFGWPSGTVFEHTSFIQQGPFNGTATATVNWHGVNTLFDDCYFGWQDGVAAWYTVYVAGSNNVVRNSTMEKGLGSWIYPDSTPPATYVGNTDAASGAPVG